MFSEQSGEWTKRVQDAVSDAFGVYKPIIGVQGGLDVAYAVQRTNQPVCAFGVGCFVDCNPHGADENVAIADLENYVRFLVGLLT